MKVTLPNPAPLDIMDGVRDVKAHLAILGYLGGELLEVEIHDRWHATVKVMLPPKLQHVTLNTEVGTL